MISYGILRGYSDRQPNVKLKPESVVPHLFCSWLAQITMLCSRPSFLRKQESRPPTPRPLDAGRDPASRARTGMATD